MKNLNNQSENDKPPSPPIRDGIEEEESFFTRYQESSYQPPSESALENNLYNDEQAAALSEGLSRVRIRNEDKTPHVPASTYNAFNPSVVNPNLLDFGEDDCYGFGGIINGTTFDHYNRHAAGLRDETPSNNAFRPMDYSYFPTFGMENQSLAQKFTTPPTPPTTRTATTKPHPFAFGTGVVNPRRTFAYGGYDSFTRPYAYGNRKHQNHNQNHRSYENSMWSDKRNIGLEDFCPISPSGLSIADIQGSVYSLARDQSGCRSLQRIFDEGSYHEIAILCNKITEHVVELMMDAFGNYLVQKMLEVCSEDQRTQIVTMVTSEPGLLVRISLNTYGTRVVQKLVTSLKTRQQISLVKSALKFGFLELITDLNGNHVIQRCLECLSTEDNKFIFDAATKHCVNIAIHRHGCCVLQRCIAHSVGQQRDKLILEIANHSLRLSQDQFGNYVVQSIIELNVPCASAKLQSMFQGCYAHLSTQKFSSHVVQKCLEYIPESRSQIVWELLNVSSFSQLLQDPYANYVIQTALRTMEDDNNSMHAMLVGILRQHTTLKTSPYCKKIFSRNFFKKAGNM